jgi:superfamily II DNA/RNA helicase
VGNLNLARTSFFVLDEADRMLDMGFIDDITKIIKQLPKNRQTMLFSATMPDEIKKLVHDILHDPVFVEIAITKPAEGIRQSAYICTEAQKNGILKHLFKKEELKRVLVFAGSKQKVKELSIILRRAGIRLDEMHSDLDQKQRDLVMRDFKAGHTDVLVATDIISRGIDIDDIAVVINYDVPRDVEDYVHRIGRTARAGRGGRAITLVSERDQMYFARIEKTLEKIIDKNPMPEELGPSPAYTGKSRPEGNRSRNGRNRNHGKGKGAKTATKNQNNNTNTDNNPRRRHRGGHWRDKKPQTKNQNN